MARRKTQKEFENELKEKFGEEYILLSDYVNIKTKIKIKHLLCGCIFERKPGDLLKSTGCPDCKNERMRKLKVKPFEVFKKEFYKILNKNEYTLLSDENEYKDSQTKIKVKHLICGYEYPVTPNRVLSGDRCPKCYGTHKRTIEELKQEILEKIGPDYELLSTEYKNTMSHVIIRHKCGYEYSVTPNRLLNGKDKCPKCSGNIKHKTTEYFKEEVRLQVGNEYTVLGEYKKTLIPVLVRHNVCDFEWLVTPNNFLSKKTRCPNCKLSFKGEKAIQEWLEENDYEYEKQYTFPDCKYKNPLKFDFKLEDVDENGNLNKIILIEFDGRQHYEPVEEFGGTEEFKLQKIRDNIKNEYCASHDNIDLYRICYLDINIIPLILTEIVRKYNKDI